MVHLHSVPNNTLAHPTRRVHICTLAGELRLEKELTDVLEAAIKACRSFPESEQVSTNFLWLVAKGKRDKYMKASAETAGVDVASPELQKMLDEV